MFKKSKTFRDDIALEFVKSLEQNPTNWKQNWSAPYGKKPYNAVTNKSYRGTNTFYLSFVAMVNGYTDPRWCTFAQIREKEWHLKKGSKGSVVEYWMPYDTEERSIISWEEFNNEPNQTLITKYYTVFNGNQIEGIPELEKPIEHNIKPNELIDKIAENIGIEILNDGLNDAYYSILEDKIHLPEAKYFENEYSYNSTALHELSHSTGHEKRLNRNIKNIFGSQDYAFEELVAEISSCFLASEIDLNPEQEMQDQHLQNHKAYVQSWIKEIKDKPETLFKAIKLADEAATYLEKNAGLDIGLENTLSIDKVKAKSQSLEEVTLNENPKPQMPELGKTDQGRKLSQAEELAKSSQNKDKE